MAYVGGTPSFGETRVDSISEAVTLNRKDSGKIFMITDSGAVGYTITLPTPANAGIGWTAKFIVNATAGSTLNGSGGEDVVFNDGQTDVMVTSIETANTHTAVDDGADTIAFDHTAKKGDWIELFSDGTIWFASGASGANGGVLVAS